MNLADFSIPDNAGSQVVDQPVVAGGPAAYFATLPVRAMLAAIRAAGVPCDLSLTAGTFLCNQVFYVELHHIGMHRPAMRAGFIHVPSLPVQAAPRPSPAASMSLETMVAGVEAAVQAIAVDWAVGAKHFGVGSARSSMPKRQGGPAERSRQNASPLQID